MPHSLITLLIGLGAIGLVGWFFWPDTGLYSRLRRVRRLTSRVLQEDALKHIQKQELSGRHVTVLSVAGALGIDTNAAIQVLTELVESGLIDHNGEDYILTQKGGQLAMNVIRAHRLWEQYLAEHTGYDPSEWHSQAERLEHDFSSAELDELAGVLGNPVYDPHGDPIPSSEGRVFDLDAIGLHELELNQFARIVHVGDEPEIVAAQIEAEGLLPGMILRVSEKTKDRVRFWSNGEEHLLAPIVAASISVQPLEDDHLVDVDQSAVYLDQLEEGQKGRVVQLMPRLRGAERRRLMDLGMLPGTTIAAELSSPLGSPVAYRIRDSLIALRNDQARNIKIEPITDEENHA
ncbi:MAG: metal-dependent transcriptional regulator [Anaerolineales bacterium]|nr:metal-dependent transcriptional regulator [Anaerolineales bacterium]